MAYQGPCNGAIRVVARGVATSRGYHSSREIVSGWVRGWGEGAALGVGVAQQPTTVAISMFSNLKHLAPTKVLASISLDFKVAPKLFLE